MVTRLRIQFTQVRLFRSAPPIVKKRAKTPTNRRCRTNAANPEKGVWRRWIEKLRRRVMLLASPSGAGSLCAPPAPGGGFTRARLEVLTDADISELREAVL